MQQALDSPSHFLEGIDFERLKSGEPQRVNVSEQSNPFADGFFTPSGKLEFYSERMKQQGLDPLPHYRACSESPENHALHQRYPLQLLAPPSVHFLNSSFGVVDEQRRRMGSPSVKINPADASRRGIQAGDLVRLFNDRGECRYAADVTEDTRQGVVVAEGLWWPKHTPDGRSVNALVSTRLTDLGAGSTFQCNLVEVAKA